VPEHHTAAFIARPERWEYACATLGRDTTGTNAAAEESATRGEEERAADLQRNAAIERVRVAHIAANLDRIESERAANRERRTHEEETLRSDLQRKGQAQQTRPTPKPSWKHMRL
jgi:hypothetical protein